MHWAGVIAGTIPGTDPEPTAVTLTPAEMAAAMVNIPREVMVPTYADPVTEFFNLLDHAFPLKSLEKVVELNNFACKKGETCR